MDFVVEQVAPGVTWLLRQQVLRPSQRVLEMALPGDDEPSSGHFAAYDISGPPGSVDEIIGVASVLEQAEPEPPGPAAAWRIRGMATLPRVRGEGVGAARLDRLVHHVRRAGGGALWANARVGAVGFYLSQGFTLVSPEFDVPGVGSHRRVRRPG